MYRKFTQAHCKSRNPWWITQHFSTLSIFWNERFDRKKDISLIVILLQNSKGLHKEEWKENLKNHKAKNRTNRLIGSNGLVGDHSGFTLGTCFDYFWVAVRICSYRPLCGVADRQSLRRQVLERAGGHRPIRHLRSLVLLRGHCSRVLFTSS